MKKTPAAVNIKNEFIKLYNSGLYNLGERIPSESNMAQTFNVSRETWRTALKLLIKEGILVSKHGSGTYICEKQHIIQNDLSVLDSYAIIAGGNINLSVHNWEIDFIDDEINSLFFEYKEKFLILKRAKFQSDVSVYACITYIPLKYDLDAENLPNSLLLFFEEKHNIYISRAVSEITVPDKNDEIYKLLNLPDNIDALQLNQLHFDTNGEPIFYSIDYLRCDKFKFTINRTRL